MWNEHMSGETQDQTMPSKDSQAYAHYEYHHTPSGEEPKAPNHSRKTSFGRRVWTTAFLGFLFGVVAAISFQAVNILLSRVGGYQLDAVRVSRLPSQDLSLMQGGGMASTEKSMEEDEEEQEEEESSLVKYASRPSEVPEEVTLTSGTVAEVAKAAMPSVVAITTVSVQEIVSFWGRYQNYTSTGTGSGILVGENEDELLIATNYHVVEDASDLSICFIGDDVVSAKKEIARAARGGTGLNISGAVGGTIKGVDQVNDLAVVAVKKKDIPEETYSRLKIAKLGSSDDLEVGEQVVAIGNALGYGQTVTSGWVSALNRTVTLNTGAEVQLLQTDAAINPGNSGGALLNMRGEVIGINCARYNSASVEGTGYAIPVSMAQPILEDLMTKVTREKVTDIYRQATLDADVADLSGSVQWMYGVPDGAFVTNVFRDGNCEASGLMSGDVITHFDGRKIYNSESLSLLLDYYEAGETVDVTVCRSSYGYYDCEEVLQIELPPRYARGDADAS